MGKTKTQILPVPKQIRPAVRTILQHAAKNDGIVSAAILFVNSKGEMGGEGKGSSVFNQVLQQALDSYNLLRTVNRQAFNDGWTMAEEAQKTQQTQPKKKAA